MKKTLKDLRAQVRQAEAELDVATTRSVLNAAVKRLIRAKEELRRAESEPATVSGAARAQVNTFKSRACLANNRI